MIARTATPLKIIIVGAGISGLCSAVALRQAGHHVKVFEKSHFAAEIGAALVLSSNGTRVLFQLGFSFERARGRWMQVWETLDGTTLSELASLDLSDARERYGAPVMTVHRVDFHRELLRLALDHKDGTERVILKLGLKVINADTESGEVELEDGTRHRADLIVAADGLHSVLKQFVLGQNLVRASPTGLSAFRFLISTESVQNDPILVNLLKWKNPGATIFADTKETESERHIIWYDCQGGEIQNFVGVHPIHNHDDVNQVDIKASMLSEFGHFHPDIIRMIGMAEVVSVWPLSVHDPLASWVRGKIVLTGDAAHPMLPFGGQGANQAIEDAGALGVLLNGVNNPDEVPQRLELFEQVRVKRASRTQILSKVRVGKEVEVGNQLQAYADPVGSAVPSSFAERNAHDFGFDVLEKSAQPHLMSTLK